MANPKRLVILMLLSRDEIAVGVLAKVVGLSQSALSQHLAKLRQANLVTTRRDAQTIYYSSRSTAVARMLLALEKIFTRTMFFEVEVVDRAADSSDISKSLAHPDEKQTL
ncbi:helix-turn-helix transcriptional regulator [Rhizobium bangladeshense]|nr:helix-turn-helix transcriptional regulator [Rhizobium bangladeshense]